MRKRHLRVMSRKINLNKFGRPKAKITIYIASDFKLSPSHVKLNLTASHLEF